MTLPNTDSSPHHQHQHQHHNDNDEEEKRIVLLFDLDCFYAQCERVRLGLPVDVSLALLQWDSVLAVTYPARKFGIKRGDSWDAVDQKYKQGAADGDMNNNWAIHLAILEKQQNQTQTQTQTQSEEPPPCEELDLQAPLLDLESAYNQKYKLTPEEQLEARKERGVRRRHHEGKACLERYRLASGRIFAVVLESLTRRLGKHHFTLEKASIDEFYLDITNYCYQPRATTTTTTTTTSLKKEASHHKTIIIGNASFQQQDPIEEALQRACQVSHWIRSDVRDKLDYTMTAGISTNKMMAKLTASYGKPNGQAVLHPDNFETVMNETKVRKVRGFGGKLGKQVLTKLLNQDENATMGALRQVPLPALQQHVSEEMARFIFHASRGIDKEIVKETSGALVKSITAFKSFPVIRNPVEIQKWIQLLANEITMRVTTDTARNNRYPKTCALNYLYSTPQRPKNVVQPSKRSPRQSRSIRLTYPAEKHPNKAQDLVQQAMEKMPLILQQHPLRGVGLSASNFESRGQPPEGVAAIDNFFTKKDPNEPSSQSKSTWCPAQRKRPRTDDHEPLFSQTQTASRPAEKKLIDAPSHQEATEDNLQPAADNATWDQLPQERPNSSKQANGGVSPSQNLPIYNKDLELAKNLQASFDRENYVFSTTNRYKGPAKKDKVRRIDTFFCKR